MPRSEPIWCDVMRTAISLATSPAACPPIPSATMKIAALGEHEVVVFVARADDADVGAGSTGEVHEIPFV